MERLEPSKELYGHPAALILLPSGVPQGVHLVLVDALSITDEELIVPSSSLVRDLGMESIDLLDIVMRLEGMYRIEIDVGDLMQEDVSNDSRYLDLPGRTFNAAGIEALQARHPFADLTSFQEHPEQCLYISSVFTVGFLTRYLAYRGIVFTSLSSAASS